MINAESIGDIKFLDFVKSRLNSQFQIKDIKREERLEIPEVALREVIINAIVIVIVNIQLDIINLQVILFYQLYYKIVSYSAMSDGKTLQW